MLKRAQHAAPLRNCVMFAISVTTGAKPPSYKVRSMLVVERELP